MRRDTLRTLLLIAVVAPLSALLTTMVVDCGPVPAPSPAPGPEVTTACAKACARLTALGCPEAAPTPHGATCATWCGKYATTAAGIDADCIARIDVCDDVARCGR